MTDDPIAQRSAPPGPRGTSWLFPTAIILAFVAGALIIGFGLRFAAGAEDLPVDADLVDAAQTDWTELGDMAALRQTANAVRGQGEVSEESFFVEAPEVVEMGWGWSQYRAEPIPTICVEFDVHTDEVQTASVSIKEVRDSYALAREMNISASVSVKAVGYDVSGKASFAKSSNISSSAVSYLINAEVLNSADFARPRSDENGNLVHNVRLTREAAELARNDIETFEDVCGEGFVAATISGARAYMLAITETSSKSERESVRTSVKGEGWGVKVTAAASGSTEAKTENFKRSFTFMQQGGKASDEQAGLPEDATQAIDRIKALAKAAAGAGKLFELQITPYQVLENFPRGADLLAQEEEHDGIAAVWGAYNTLYGDLKEALERPEEHYIPLCTAGNGGCEPKMVNLGDGGDALALAEQLQDMALLALSQIETAAALCLELEEHCDFAEESVRSPYSVRASMPVRYAPGDVSPKPPVPTLDEHFSLHLREAAAGRCVYGALTQGCISNDRIRRWAERTGMFNRVLDEGEAAGLRGCVDAGTVLLGDPGDPEAEVLWYPAGFEAEKCPSATLEANTGQSG